MSEDLEGKAASSPRRGRAAGPTGAKTNAERGRTFRLNQKRVGRKPLSILISSSAESAIPIIRATMAASSSKRAVVELALVAQAERIAGTPAALINLLSTGQISELDYANWKIHLESNNAGR